MVYSLPETVYGSGGKSVRPDGSIILCPIPNSELCAKFGENMSGNTNYPDLLEVYGPTGNLLETREVDVISVGSDNQSINYWSGPLHTGSVNSNIINQKKPILIDEM
jgi:hypothetical protein